MLDKSLNSLIKSMQCPKCGSSNYRRFKRKNYPFGKKSKPVISKGKQCFDCNYIKLDKELKI